MRYLLLACLCFATVAGGWSQGQFQAVVHTEAKAVESKVIEWRRHLHQYPELSNREFKTAAMVEAHLRQLGLEVRTQVGHTGVVGILRGGKPGKTVALRADMDALPVEERVDLPFASKERTVYAGVEAGVMHACGHDTHVAMLMGAAEILAGMRERVPGTVVFIFQPAEEGAPAGEEGGAELMVKEGVLKNPDVDAVFGIHINSGTSVGEVRFRPGGTMAAVNSFTIKVMGQQTHGSTPWTGVDPVVVSAQIIMGLQTIVSRQMDLTKEAAVISVGKITGGVRSNIIPEEVELVGTIRTLDVDMQRDIHERIRRTATSIAEASGATVEVTIDKGYPVTYNDPQLTALMGPTMKAVMGEDNVILTRARTGAEDFSFYAREVPGLFVFLGGMTPGMDPDKAPPHHTPYFFIDEAAMRYGVELYANFALDYLVLQQ